MYVCNLVTKPGQTDGYQVNDFADEIERLAGHKFLDAVIFNTEQPSHDLLEKYAKDGELSVGYDEAVLADTHYLTIGASLLSNKIWYNRNSSDPIAATRTLIRHDSAAIADVIIEVHKAVIDTRDAG